MAKPRNPENSRHVRVGAETEVAELAGLVAGKLAEHGLSATLVGGAVVSIYTDNRYESGDLDFVIEKYVIDFRLLDQAMEELGFVKNKGRVYTHPECRYAVDFPQGPVRVGDENVRDPDELPVPTGRVRILTPTHSVMDRLAAFYHAHDAQGLEQAVWVAQDQKVNLAKVREWSIAEGMAAKYAEFEARLAKTSGKRRV